MFFLGIAHSAYLFTKNSIEHIDKAIDINPKNADAHYHKADLLLNGWQEISFNPRWRKEDIDMVKTSIKHFKKAVSIDPSFAQAYKRLGRANSFLNNHKKAIENFSDALEHDPDWVSAYYWLANEKEKIGDLQGAEKDRIKYENLK